MRKKKQKPNINKIMANILYISLALSLAYAVLRLIIAPADGTADVRGRVKSDYVLMMIQCVLGLAVISLPSILQKRWAVAIPNFIYVLYYIFLYCAIFLGEMLSFYYRVPHWDSILHAFSGAMLGSLGFILVDLLNREEHINVHLSPFFVALFAFCFALAAGAVWEIYEYTLDSILHLNMQKYATEAGELLIGHAALLDTMKDLILDAAAALVVSILGYLSIRKKKIEPGNPDAAKPA